MKYLLVKEKKNEFSLYCPETYGAKTWGSLHQESIVRKRKSWYYHSWSAGNEWIEDEEYQHRLNVVLETSDFDEVFNYVKEHNEKEIEKIIKEVREICEDYFNFCEWIYAAYKNH